MKQLTTLALIGIAYFVIVIVALHFFTSRFTNGLQATRNLSPMFDYYSLGDEFYTPL